MLWERGRKKGWEEEARNRCLRGGTEKSKTEEWWRSEESAACSGWRTDTDRGRQPGWSEALCGICNKAERGGFCRCWKQGRRGEWMEYV